MIMTKAKILRKHLGNVLPSFEGTVILDIGNAMDEWATQQCAQQWTTVKPSEPCVFVAATNTIIGYKYKCWELKLVKNEFTEGDEEALVLVTEEGYEFDDIDYLKADKYLILPKHD